MQIANGVSLEQVKVKFPDITNVKFSSYDVDTTSADNVYLTKFLHSFPLLERFEVGFGLEYSAGSGALASTISSLPHLRHLSMLEVPFEEKEMSEIFSNQNKLETLGIYINNLDDDSVQLMAKMDRLQRLQIKARVARAHLEVFQNPNNFPVLNSLKIWYDPLFDDDGKQQYTQVESQLEIDRPEIDVESLNDDNQPLFLSFGGTMIPIGTAGDMAQGH